MISGYMYSREDLNSALAYGGNKTRKLEYLVADAVDQRCDTLVSIGGPKQPYPAGSRGSCARGSTHPEHWVDWEYPGYETSGFGIKHKSTAMGLVEECRDRYCVCGVCVRCVCAVTGSTVAGMVAGFKLIEKLYPEEEAKKGAHGGKRRKVVGIDASAKPAETRAQVLRIAKDTAEKIGLGAEQITEEDIVLDERYHAGVYGIPDKQTWDMVRRGKISSGQRQLVVYNPRW
ncbi:1-aminocyclopropane-1-carboxylate deaminase [Blastomyces dermatitidis ER-3]|uniref:1-aminocyclopropane-1-carboxylate deaminase n=1 Tax=Ajellomyces dermatitidis (strain ER-3 / ATCC MYA-2586) TaxID=559297 RepID=A0ABP2EN70_AJEDR|nr:1-aminocyclopropane-1-carboxylate deaminase [Blastomyces dermatitidis ER-3]EEQ84845.2 1-aminocyclopropane-1-carboxylate deaminase [Blastomyces dermatitidis ER-3]